MSTHSLNSNLFNTNLIWAFWLKLFFFLHPGKSSNSSWCHLQAPSVHHFDFEYGMVECAPFKVTCRQYPCWHISFIMYIDLLRTPWALSVPQPSRWCCYGYALWSVRWIVFQVCRFMVHKWVFYTQLRILFSVHHCLQSSRLRTLLLSLRLLLVGRQRSMGWTLLRR